MQFAYFIQNTYKDLRHIYEDIVSNDMSWDEFNNFCEEVFNFPYSFIAINKDADVENGRYIKTSTKFLFLTIFFIKMIIYPTNKD